MSYSENVTYDWCWQCNSYHRTEPGQPLNTTCKPRPQDTDSERKTNDKDKK